MEYMQHSLAPKNYQRWAFVSAVAGALERKVWLTRDHDIGWYPNMYLFIVGPPGSGKSVVAEAAVRILQEVPDIDFLAESINGASLFHDLAAIGKQKRFEWNGENYPHCAATLFASEASETFVEQYKGGGIIDKLTNLYNGGIFGWSMRHGPGRSTRMDGNAKTLNPCINLLACSTPEWLITKCVNRLDAAGGFGSRMLVIVSRDELKNSSEWESGRQAKDMKLRQAIVEDLCQVAKMRGSYFAGAGFHEAYAEYSRKAQEDKANKIRTGVIGGYQTRKETHLMKLTMILAAARRNEMLVTGRDLEDAQVMLAAIEPSMIEVLNDLEMTPDAKMRRELIVYFKARKSKTILRTELLRDFHNHDLGMVNFGLNGLIAMGRLAKLEAGAGRVTYQFIDN